MQFAKISNVHTAKTPRTRLSLRPGQILQGEVLKIFPGNKAEVRLGMNRLVAQLEVGLELGAKYHFQVASNADYPVLRVLGEPLTKTETADLETLLRQLGLKESRGNLELLQMLTRNSIPFDKAELHQAIRLLKRESDQQTARAIILEMFARRLPMTASTYQSLKAIHETNISEQLKTVLQQIRASQKNQGSGSSIAETNDRLFHAIAKLVEKPQAFRQLLIGEIISQNTQNKQTLFRTFQGLGFIPLDLDFSTWQKAWTQTVQSPDDISSVQGQRAAVHQLPLQADRPVENQLPAQYQRTIESRLPFRLNVQEMAKVFKKINENEQTFKQNIRLLSDKWEGIRLELDMTKPIPRDAIQELRTTLVENLQPFLNGLQLARLETAIVDGQQVNTLFSILETLADSGNLSQLLKFIAKMDESSRFLSLTPKQQFMEHVRQAIPLLGINYENRLVTNKEPSALPDTIKGLLLQLGAEGNVKSGESLTGTLQLIQGLQIQSVAENQSFVHVSLQLPAERLGLIKDLSLEFEGKKDEHGQINPDFCRILFYLDLEGLKETVIDVNIQQRAVSLTIFNNTPGLPKVVRHVKDKLKSALQSLDYRFMSLQFKKLEDRELVKPAKEEIGLDQTKRVDYRI